MAIFPIFKIVPFLEYEVLVSKKHFVVFSQQSPEDVSDFNLFFLSEACYKKYRYYSISAVGPLHLEITSYKKRHAGGQMTLWDIENKDTKFKFKCPSASFIIQYGGF